MIIIKTGNTVNPPWKGICSCGCEALFETNQVDKTYGPEYTTECPECNNTISVRITRELLVIELTFRNDLPKPCSDDQFLNCFI